MTVLHTFGCSVTQGFALPDVVRPVLNPKGIPYTPEEIRTLGIEINWEDIHVLAPSRLAWPQQLADKLGIQVYNHARRGFSFQQIARHCAVHVDQIQPEDTVIVMWTYLSRLSLQWPARTSVPLCNIADPFSNWRTLILGINRWFGLSGSGPVPTAADTVTQKYIETSLRKTHLDPLGIYDRYYNCAVLQELTDGYLQRTGARVIHLSVEAEPVLDQLEDARQELDISLRHSYTIPPPEDFYRLSVDYNCTPILFDPSIPLAENDMHPSVEHHSQFAEYLHTTYFADQP